jgi:hypothetical protein
MKSPATIVSDGCVGSAIATLHSTDRTQRLPFHLTVRLLGWPSMCRVKRHLTQPNLGRRTRLLGAAPFISAPSLIRTARLVWTLPALCLGPPRVLSHRSLRRRPPPRSLGENATRALARLRGRRKRPAHRAHHHLPRPHHHPAALQNVPHQQHRPSLRPVALGADSLNFR